MLPAWFAWGVIIAAAVWLFSNAWYKNQALFQKPPPKPSSKRRKRKPPTKKTPEPIAAATTPAPIAPVVAANMPQQSELYQVIAWYDGDTVEVQQDKHAPLRLRLEGIDAPEMKQAFGVESLAFAQKHATGKVRVQFHTDSQTYGRSVAQLFFKDHKDEWQDYGLKLIAAGLAWAEPQYLRKNDPRYTAYQAAQKVAKKDKKGLWSNPRPLRPQTWRESQKNQ